MIIVTQEKNAPSKIVLTYCGIEKKQYVLKFVEENEFCTNTLLELSQFQIAMKNKVWKWLATYI